MQGNPMRFDELPIGCLFMAGDAMFLKTSPAQDPRIKSIPEQPSNCRCLTGERKGHHCTFGPKVYVKQILLEFRFR
jgi:hypothetical protein